MGYCDDFILSAYLTYSVATVTELLLMTGIQNSLVIKYAGDMSRLVYGYGNDKEVYTAPEMSFIKDRLEVIAFDSFLKTSRKSVVPCRIISTKLDDDILPSSIAFAKILNKAFDGLNLFFFVTAEGFLFAGRVFSRQDNIDCYLSELIVSEERFVELSGELMFSSDIETFADYYSYVRSVLQYKNDDAYSMLHENNKLTYSYIEGLQKAEKQFGVSYSDFIDGYFEAEEERHGLSYADLIEESREYLFKIESNQVNTMEMLFAAEEMEKIVFEAEKRTEAIFSRDPAEGHEENQLSETERALLEDPENMIRMLKKKRGI